MKLTLAWKVGTFSEDYYHAECNQDKNEQNEALDQLSLKKFRVAWKADSDIGLLEILLKFEAVEVFKSGYSKEVHRGAF